MFVCAIFPMSCGPVYIYNYVRFLVKGITDVVTVQGMLINL
jgi:hypothetical protein